MGELEQRLPRPLFEHVDSVHQAIHERGMYGISKTFLSVANDGYADIHITPPVGYEAHTRIYVAAEGKAYIKTYNSTTYTNQGTQIIPFNRVTDGDATTLLAYYTPTINLLGNVRGDDLINGGGGGNSVGGSASSEFESIIAPVDDFLIRVQNKSGIAKDINIIFNFYLRKRG